jgi:hypothetical protein
VAIQRFVCHGLVLEPAEQVFFGQQAVQEGKVVAWYWKTWLIVGAAKNAICIGKH